MKKNLILLSTIVGLSIGGYLFYRYNYKKKPFGLNLSAVEIPVEKIDGVVKMEEIIEWFKDLSLNKEIHTPFIVNGSRLQELIPSYNDDNSLSSVFVGVYNERMDELSNYKLFSGIAFNKSLTEVLSHATNDNPVVVLN